VEALPHPDALDERRGRDAQGCVGDQRRHDLRALGGPEEDLLDRLRARIRVDPDLQPQRLRTLAACKPLGPRVTSNSTSSPSARLLKPCAAMALKWTNTSSPPSWVMNPKPFASLNHFTRPCAMTRTFLGANPVMLPSPDGGDLGHWRANKNAARTGTRAAFPSASLNQAAT